MAVPKYSNSNSVNLSRYMYSGHVNLSAESPVTLTS